MSRQMYDIICRFISFLGKISWGASFPVPPPSLRFCPSPPPAPSLRAPSLCFPPFTPVPRSSASEPVRSPAHGAPPARFRPSGPRLSLRIATPTRQNRPVRRIFEKISPESFASSKPCRTFALAKRNKAHRQAREATIFERLT